MTELEKYYNNLILLSEKWVIAVSLFPLLFGLFRWRKFNKTLKIFWIFLLVTLGLYLVEQVFVWSTAAYTDFWRPILKAYDISNTNFLRYPYQVINFTLLGWFLYRILLPQPIAQWLIPVSILLLVSVTINYFFIQGYNMAGGANSLASNLYCLVFPLIYMWFLYNSDSRVPLVHNPYFWINLGLIIPGLLNLFLYFVGDIMYKEYFILFARLTILKNIIEMAAQVLTAVGFYYARNVKYLDSL